MLKLCVELPVLTSVTRLMPAAFSTLTGSTEPISTQSGAEAMIGRDARWPPGAKK